MRKNKTKKKPIDIKNLAGLLEQEVDKQLNVVPLPNGSTAYKNYIIKQNANGNWAVYNYKNHDFLDEFYLKSTALAAVKSYDNINMEKYLSIKELDRQYWAAYTDLERYQQKLPKIKDFDDYLIAVNRLEESRLKADHCRDKITNIFRWSFV